MADGEIHDSASEVPEDEDDADLKSVDSDPYGGESDDSQSGKDKKSKSKRKSEKKEPKEKGEKKEKDDVLLKREASLLHLVKKHFHEKVIVFFNEKAEVTRMLTLFTAFGLKAV